MASYLRFRAAIMAPTRYQCCIRPLLSPRSTSVGTKGKGRHPCRQKSARSMSVYGFGQQWTGALSRGPSDLFLEEAPEITPEEVQQFGEPQNMILLRGTEASEGRRCVAASAGWGHTALLLADKKTDSDGDSSTPSSPIKLMVCGRPHDFQTLMRLRRLPPFIRNFCIKYTLPSEEDDDEQLSPNLSPSVMQRIASYLAGNNEITFHEEECRRYSNVPTLLEIELPNGEIPALEGDDINQAAFESHAGARVAKEQENENDKPQKNQHFHTQFQNTLATCAGVTAIISKTGTLYTFGLNQRGQCGSGSFSPNIWSPSRVFGMGSTRFILDNQGPTSGSDGDMFKDFKEQQNPIVSVSLGLQHGVALDSEGQVFCWGKGERGQLGQGRRTLHEQGHEKEDDEGDEGGGNYNNGVGGEDQPNENRTFEYALHVPNFYDPYATISPSISDDDKEAYAPLLSQEDSKVRLISAGMNFTLAVTESNLPYIWGKNVCLNPSYSESGINIRKKPVQDSTYPRYIPGLPDDNDLRIERIACGTHHAAMLLEDGSIWAVGVATDRPVPLWDEAVEILAPGLVDMKELVSFTAGFDRTVVVYGTDRGKNQVIEIQLWSHEELRQHGAVRPSWLDWLESNDESSKAKVCSVHRGWMHSVVVTEE